MQQVKAAVQLQLRELIIYGPTVSAKATVWAFNQKDVSTHTVSQRESY